MGPIELYGLTDLQVALVVFVFATAGWIMGKLHEVVQFQKGDAVAKAQIIQGIVASYVGATFAFWVMTPYWRYPLLAGVAAATIVAYLGVRAIEAVAAVGLDGIKAIAERFVASRKTP
jgi:hypothetical protein